MPRPDHFDNGPVRRIDDDDCPYCGAWYAWIILENDVYHFERCNDCGMEEPPELLEPPVVLSERDIELREMSDLISRRVLGVR